MSSWYRQDRDGAFCLSLHIQPGAKKSSVAGLHGEALKIRLAAPPVDGKANTALVAFVAELLQLPRAAVSLKSGQTSRQKVLRVEGVDEKRLADLASLTA
ncbi:DUF167 domain-containing protein [Azovibrio restrictus]|uniref:DUF167 domain-containing protein n=1 Tax=Azovibrio restrictus TaxID=146938 RepID=UPI0026F21EB6|nr:DUF167 domain-containing protein [Azovibrio restrictus]MDD3483585.1 DUF167 domain-containing protein [Azovibrio restrictus]